MQFAFNDNVQFAVIGIDFQYYEVLGEIGFAAGPDVEVKRLGKLTDVLSYGGDVGKFSVQKIQQALVSEGWPWDIHPNPEIVLMERKEAGGKIIVVS